MPNFTRVPGKFAYSGMDIHHPPDLLPEGRCPLLFNLQPDLLAGALTVRPPIAALATTAGTLPVHSIIRMNDLVPNVTPFARYVGTGPDLYFGSGAGLTFLDTGFSGLPLAMVPYRPPMAPEPWLYTYDSNKQRRYKTDGTIANIGIQAPTAEPTLARVRPLYTIVENAAALGSWSGSGGSGGTASGGAIVSRLPATTTINAILYDSGSSGMCVISPTNPSGNFAWMTQGSMVTIAAAESVVIEQAFPSGMATTVSAIAYDVGSTGLCTIVPAVPVPGIQRNMIVNLNSGTYVRVLSVTAGPDGSYSFRCSTGGTTIAAGQAIAVPPSFRCWTTGTRAAGNALTGSSIEFVYTPTVMNGAMQDITQTGTITTLDLTQAGGRPIQNEDYMHISMLFDHPEWVTEIHVMLGMGVSPTFANDYYYYVLRPGDFQSSITGMGGVTTQQATLQAQLEALATQISSTGTAEGVGENVAQPPYPIAEIPSTNAPQTAQLTEGANSWTEVMFKISDLTRVGSAPSLTLADVVKLGIYVSTSGGVVTMDFGGWWVGGGYGPDCNFNTYGNQDPEIQWRYRYRSSATGAKSTVSPETRNGEILRRQAVTVTAPVSPDAQADLVDWERRGGSNPDWHYIGTIAPGFGFIDNITEAAAQIGDPLEVTTYQPWPVTDVPQGGQATVTGTHVVWSSGSKFNLRWLRGTEIVIGNNTYSLFAPPTSDTVLELAENVTPPAGSYFFLIPEATIEGQPIYGAWLDEANNRICAVGDPFNPGLMYYTNVDNPDGASDSGTAEITSPSEPLLNGFYAEGANYIFTSSSLYRVESTPGAVSPYAAYRLSGIEGLAGAWGFDYQRRMLSWWGPDGIYAYAFGAAAENISAPDFLPLFPHEGQLGRQMIPGVPVSISGQTIFPPNYARDNFLRIGYNESFLYATYFNSNADVETLVYSFLLKGWRKDIYKPQATMFVLEKGVEQPLVMVGAIDGQLYNITQNTAEDAGGTIDWAVLTRVTDAGDSRAVKQFGDLMLDYSGTFNIQVLWDNLLVSGVSAIVPAFTDRTHYLQDLFTPPDTNDTPLIHYNMACLLTGVGCPVYLYEWQPSFLALPEITTSRVTDWQSGGALHYKFVQGIRIHANTFGLPKQVQVQYDGYQLGPVITVNFNGEQTQPFSFAVPFKCHMMRLVPLDDTPWDLFLDSEWVFEPEPEPANYWISQPTALGQSGYLHARELWMPYAAPGAGSVVSVIVDGGAPVTLASLAASVSPSKQYFPLPPLKGRYWQLTASGTGLQIYENDLEMLVKSWGSTGPYARVKPFGDVSGGAGRSGARI